MNNSKFDKKPAYRYSGCHSYDVSALNIVGKFIFTFYLPNVLFLLLLCQMDEHNSKFDKKPAYRYSGCHSYDVSALNIVLGKIIFHVLPPKGIVSTAAMSDE